MRRLVILWLYLLYRRCFVRDAFGPDAFDGMPP